MRQVLEWGFDTFVMFIMSSHLYRALKRVWQDIKNQYDSLLLALGVVLGGAVFWALAVPGEGMVFSAQKVGMLGVFLAGAAGMGAVRGGYEAGRRWLSAGLLCGFLSAWGWTALAVRDAPPPRVVRDGHAVWVVGPLEAVMPRDGGRVAVQVRPAWVMAGDGVVHAVPAVRVTVAEKRLLGLVKEDNGVTGHGDGEEGDRWPDLKGQGLAFQAQLFGPTGPKFAGDRDDRWWWLFGGNRRIIKGYVRGTLETTEVPVDMAKPQGWRGRLDLFEQARAHVVAGTRGMSDGVLAALLVGEDDEIPRALYEAYRNSGLLHLLVISGLQMTIVAGGIFWLVARGLLWLPRVGPWLGLYMPMRAIGASLALLGVAFYAGLVGGEVSVLRAVLMTGLGLLALVFGRGKDVLRLWALVLAGLLIVFPEWGLRAGFQLSFAAVGGLIVWGMLRADSWQREGMWGWFHRGLMMVESTLVASLATAPFLLWHFSAVPVAGVVANVVAIPLMTVATWLGFMALVLWPAGLHSLPLAG
ncbi:MAG: hypothetical protein COY40_06620, partial [Alphaproteobacteria bacterium CG_4_10_14_0_8_um_filter_53_9]